MLLRLKEIINGFIIFNSKLAEFGLFKICQMNYVPAFKYLLRIIGGVRGQQMCYTVILSCICVTNKYEENTPAIKKSAN